MQGTVLVPGNLQQGSSPPQSTETINMNESGEPEKDSSNRSQQSDSGFFSTTANTTAGDSDNRSDCSSPDKKYICPICDITLTSSHEFTMHIRSHNNDSEEQNNEKGFACKICHKILSSSSSLDRHVLVHSGERPFHCKFCGDSFTTNGNMHRHMRTHSNKCENYESDGSSDSESIRSAEFNNNQTNNELNNNKRKTETLTDLEDQPKKKPKNIHFSFSQRHRCPVCERDDFTTISNLNGHMKDNHPEYPATCSTCEQVFINNKLLNIHEHISHGISLAKNAVPGFEDLTFVDFTSNKFPIIAQHECEINLHTVSSGGLSFQCNNCLRAFPCSNSLDKHLEICSEKLNENTMALKTIPDDELRRRDFFSRLNLQNNHEHYDSRTESSKSTPNKLKQHLISAIDNSQDLADIQSILSNINLQKIRNEHAENREDMEKPGFNQDDSNKNEGEEEAQDSFVIEFRKMKLRGEFPCRLCTAVFPNLRALKGHNRAHLNGNNSGTYFCNMCPHSSIDKAALIRHMRTHNGDRPYECSICNYAFTTKANCERHLRNRHSKTTRDEVKKSIIYHPSEDPTNEDLNKLNVISDQKATNLNLIDERNDSSVKIHCSTPKKQSISHKPEISLKATSLPLISGIQKLRTTRFSKMDIMRDKNEETFCPNSIFSTPKSIEGLSTKYNNNMSLPDTIASRFPDRIDITQRSDYFNAQSDDVALDLRIKRAKSVEAETLEDLSRKNTETISEASKFSSNFTEVLHQQLLTANRKIDPTTLYASHLAKIYRSGFPGWLPSFPVNSLLFSTLSGHFPRSPPAIMKERMQRFQLYGGTLISEEYKSLASSPLQAGETLNWNPLQIHTEITTDSIMPEKSSKELSDTQELTPISLTLENDNNKVESPVPSSNNTEIMHSPNSVKMVIKNGVLMPKQKQRRYRTERPFTCEHCSARFTLRSNMERHIKQQHPQYWSQRHKNAICSNTKKNIGMQMKPYEVNIPRFEMYKLYDYAESKDHMNEKLKYAIFTQEVNLKENEIKKEDDSDSTLVIDENDEKSHDSSVCKFDENILVKLEDSYENSKHEEDLVPISRLLDNASQQQFKQFFERDPEESEVGGVSEEDEEGLVAGGNTSEENISGTDENRFESDAVPPPSAPAKKQSAYSLAPNRVCCPYCSRKFPWTSSLRRHILTHTGQKPFKCSHCPLLFTTKSNCDRHLLRKHGNFATAICNDSKNNNSLNQLLRNVPERPFKCALCPSSTFSTYSNLNKHVREKHSSSIQSDEIKAQGYEAGSSEDEKVHQSDLKPEWRNSVSFTKFGVRSELESTSTGHSLPNTDLPFKCHLCEGSFGERQEALDHIREKHTSDYDLLMLKNALEINASILDEPPHEDDEEIRGKFPDYSNRKVVCAWCMRRFWSAEDLRRHMRTHTGERPFSCDICRRRFTLKHSMLRHRKKHNLNQMDHDTNVSDEDGNFSTSTEKLIADENSANNIDNKKEKTDESEEIEGDLISNLLGLRDRSIIDRVLDASADDAAKLLGVKNAVK